MMSSLHHCLWTVYFGNHGCSLFAPWRKYKGRGPVPYCSTAGSEAEWAESIWWAEYTIQPKTLGKFKGESCVKVFIFALIPQYIM